MKVALLVFPLHYSHGCLLQTYALYSKLKDLGCEVTILDRQPNSESFIVIFKCLFKRIAKRVLRGYRGPIFYKGYFPITIMREQQSFIDRFRSNVVSVFSTKELRSIIVHKKYDAIVVGSDQTWRPRNVPNVMDYWLEFASDLPIVKIAYAPSFGVDIWEYTKEQTEKCRELSKLFKGISVREKSGVKLCYDNLGIETLHVLDPTMLWTKSFYAPIAEKHPLPKGEVNCYFLDKDEKKDLIANNIAKVLGQSVSQINTRTEDPNAPISERIAPSIEKWLAGFYYGEFIVVDSFHAMVFSIIFEKPFVVIGNKQRGLARFESLLGELGLLNRLIFDNEPNLNKIIESPIDWMFVRSKLEIRRNDSLNFLLQHLY